MSSVYVVCWIFLQTFQTYFCIQANSVDPDVIWVHTVCRNDFLSNWQKTKQTTIVVIGALRVNKNLIFFLISVWWKYTTWRLIKMSLVRQCWCIYPLHMYTWRIWSCVVMPCYMPAKCFHLSYGPQNFTFTLKAYIQVWAYRQVFQSSRAECKKV